MTVRVGVPPLAPQVAVLQVVLTLCSLASGAALVASIVLVVPLGVTLGSLATLASAAAGVTWSRTPVSARPVLSRRARVGVFSGVVATLAYDASRFILVSVTGSPVRPFEALPLFGQLILGPAAPASIALIVGTAFHYLNGLAFGLAYAILLGTRGWLAGILWALGLELGMVAVYPGWLHIGALLEEFVAVSLIGHLAYGSVLGYLSRRWLRTSTIGSSGWRTDHGLL